MVLEAEAEEEVYAEDWIQSPPSELEEEEEEDDREPAHSFTPPPPLINLLPLDCLILEVFSRLPLLSIYLLRLLSKSWYASLSSPTFLAAWSRHAAASSQPWLVVGDVRLDAPDVIPSDPELLAFCPTQYAPHTWLSLPIHSPGPRILPRPLSPYFMSYDLLADSAGGLVCAIARHDNPPQRSSRHQRRRRPARHRRGHIDNAPAMTAAADQVLPPIQYWSYMNCQFTFVVFNPLTGQSRALPAPPSPLQLAAEGLTLDFEDPHGLLLTMVASPATSHYNVIVCRTCGGSHYYSGGMLIFNSQNNLWSCITSSSSSSSSSSSDIAISHGDAGISILQADLFEWNEAECLVLGYFMSSDTWCKLPGPSSLHCFPSSDDPALITTYNGRLLLARPICSGSRTAGFCIWEFQQPVEQQRTSGGDSDVTTTYNSWVLIVETPDEFLGPIGGSVYGEDDAADYRIIRSGSLVCLLMSNFDNEIRNYVDDDFFLSNLTYDLDQHTWSRLPPIDEVGLLFTGGFSFQPSFVATV